MISFIVQARSGSTRLPNKILLPFYRGQSILDLLIAKLKKVDGTNIIIATSSNPNCDSIEKVAAENGVLCFRGSENDVLQRFIDAAESQNTENIIRVCSDNPFLELDSIKKLVSKVSSFEKPIDYVSFNIGGTPSIKTHYGFWTEYVTLPALKKIKALTNDSIYHEHVTNYIYSHPEQFAIHWIEGPKSVLDNPDIRLTIDTEADFLNAKKIYKDCCACNPYPTIDEVISFLNRNKDFYLSMKQQISINSK